MIEIVVSEDMIKTCLIDTEKLCIQYVFSLQPLLI